MLSGNKTEEMLCDIYYPALVQSGNRYAYAMGSPVVFIDPTGSVGIMPDGSIYVGEDDTWVDVELLQYKQQYVKEVSDVEKSLIAQLADELRKSHPGEYKVLAEHPIEMYYIPDVTQKLDEFIYNKEGTFEINSGDLFWFASQVKTGAVVDLKSYHTDFIRPAESYHIIYDGAVLRADAPGNIAYGYLGMAADMGKNLLLYAAGIYQMFEDSTKHGIEVSPLRIFDNYGDNEGDPEQILIGIHKYQKEHPPYRWDKALKYNYFFII